MLFTDTSKIQQTSKPESKKKKRTKINLAKYEVPFETLLHKYILVEGAYAPEEIVPKVLYFQSLGFKHAHCVRIPILVDNRIAYFLLLTEPCATTASMNYKKAECILRAESQGIDIAHVKVIEVNFLQPRPHETLN